MPNARLLPVLLLTLASACTERTNDARSGSNTKASSSTTATSGSRGGAPGTVADESTPAAPYVETGDLDALKARGYLRVSIKGKDRGFLPRAGSGGSEERALAATLARALGLELTFVEVDAHEDLISSLEKGEGDLVLSDLTITARRSKRVSFTRAVMSVDELLIGRTQTRGSKAGSEKVSALPTTLEELAGRTVHIRPSSAYRDTLEKLQKRKVPSLKIAFVDDALDTEHVLYQVGQGQIALTVADDAIFEMVRQYTPNLEASLRLTEKRPLAWAVRKSNPKLRDALNAFLIENQLSKHRKKRFTDDLEAIQKRGVLRVLTRNNAVSYFLYKGEQRGFEFELAELIAKELGVRLEVVVPPDRAQLIPWLLEGRGDMIAAGLTITEARTKRVAFSAPYLKVQERVVGFEGGPKVASLADMKKKTFSVRKSSSYFATLERLKPLHGPFEITPVPEAQETEEILQRVASKELELTVADSHLIDIEQQFSDQLVEGVALGDEESKQIAYAVRPKSKALKTWLDGFVKKNYRGMIYNVIKKRYFAGGRRVKQQREARVSKSGRISRYDALIKKYSTRYGLDWRLMAAQAYVESRFDPKAKSWVGAIGLFQVMPNTGKSMGFHNLERPEQGVHAGIKYMDKMLRRFDAKIPINHRIRLALAAYNVGLGHVYDAQRLAKEQGLDPNKWFGNVEKAMLLLKQKEYARRARHGFCRGDEPVRYVSHIQTLYDAYVELLPN